MTHVANRLRPARLKEEKQSLAILKCTRRSLAILFLVLTSGSLMSQTGNLTPPLPNWGVPTYISDYPLPSINNYQAKVPFVSGACTSAPAAGGIAFTFSINDAGSIPATPTMPKATGALSTSAVVYDTNTNAMAATLWNSVTISNGTYCGTWNGYLDTGTLPTLAPSDHNYQIRLLHNNVQYTWDGMVGVTESSLGGPENWDSAGSFPAGMSFLKYTLPGQPTADFGVVANGYTEGTIEASVFKSYDAVTQHGDPDTVWPLNLALASSGEFDFTATDGNTVYFAARQWDNSHSNAVVGFTLTGKLPPMSANTPVELVTTNGDGSQTLSTAPLTTYGQAPWGNPYIFTSVVQELPVPSGLPRYFTNFPAHLVLSDTAVPHSVGTANQPFYFDNGIAVGPALSRSQTLMDPSGKAESVYSYIDSLTGIAVQRSPALPGNLLGVAHGLIQPVPCMSQPTSGNSLTLWDKQTGALLGVLGLGNNNQTKKPINPQKMAFDLVGNLWVIDGGVPAVDCSYPNHPLYGNRSGTGRDPIWKTYGGLIKITFKGGASQDNPPTIASIASIPSLSKSSVTLSNPVDVAVSPVTGHIFVADGGVNQQVFEFDGSTLNVYSSTGTPGGYGQSLSDSLNTCNASIGNSTLWLDYYSPGTGVTRPWISIDNEDGLWVGDYSTSRILRFSKNNGSYIFSGLSQKNRYQYLVSVPRNEPTRVFSGYSGMLEYSVTYPIPDPAAGASPPVGNTALSASPIRNWLACFLQSEWQSGGYPDTSVQLSSVELFDGGTFGSVRYHSSNPAVSHRHAIIMLPESGKIGVESSPTAANSSSVPFTMGALFDANGSVYTASITNGSCGKGSSTVWVCETIMQYTTNGSDKYGFPTWNTNGNVLGTVSLSLLGGDPKGDCSSAGCNFAPTANNVVPLYSGSGWDWHGYSHCQPNDGTCSPTTAPTYHLGAITVGSNATKWHAQLEANVEYPNLLNDLKSSAPSTPSTSKNINNLGLYSTWVSYVGAQNMGMAAVSFDNFIFAAVNGNWQQFSCQFYQYTDDGILVGQFGWRSNGYYLMGAGAPSALRAEALAPGRCGNPQMFSLVNVNGDYFLYVTDEGYRAGVQRWHIWNTASIGWLKGTTVSTLSMQASPLVLE